MRLTTVCFFTSATAFLLLCIFRPSSSQIVGCAANGVDCPAKNDDGSGVCAYGPTQDGIGIVSFDSNVTSGPLTWTMTEREENTHPQASTLRGFWLGSPQSLNFSTVTDFGACAFVLSGVASALQLPAGFNDYGNFGCSTVMGNQCAQDMVSKVRTELLRLLNEISIDLTTMPCSVIRQELEGSRLPDSCISPLRTDTFRSEAPESLTRTRDSLNSRWQTQKTCTLTTGGSDYNMAAGPDQTFLGDLESQEAEVFKNGTTPLFTLFYNEPWNNATTGPASFLGEPEVHLSCMRKVPTAEQQQRQSGSTQLQSDLRTLCFTWLLLCTLLLTNAVM